jgi:NTE family protein
LEILKSINFNEIIKLNLLSGTVFKFTPKAKELIDSILEYKSFDKLNCKLYVTICDFKSGDILYVNTGSLSDSILASCSLYPLFPIYCNLDRYYVDGGFMNNLPIEPLKSGNTIVALNVNPKHYIKNKRLKFFFNIKRIIFLLFYANIKARDNLANFYFESTEIGKFSILNRKDFDKMFHLGYKFATEDNKKNDFIKKIKDNL